MFRYCRNCGFDFDGATTDASSASRAAQASGGGTHGIRDVAAPAATTLRDPEITREDLWTAWDRHPVLGETVALALLGLLAIAVVLVVTAIPIT